MTKTAWVAGWLAVMMAQAATAQTPAFDPRSWKRDVAGPKTQVLVVGSSHLGNLKGFQPAWMSAVLDKLAAYKPTIVTIESLSGQQCEQLRRYPTIYPGLYDEYCRSTDAAQKATGLDQATAVAQMEAMARHVAGGAATGRPAAAGERHAGGGRTRIRAGAMAASA